MTTVSRSFLMGLVGFLWQASLSLDRIEVYNLKDLVDFYSNKSCYAPHDVREQLKQINLGIGEAKVRNGLDSKEQMLLTNLLLKLWRKMLGLRFLSGVRVADTHLYFAEKALCRLEELLSDTTLWNKETAHGVRIELAQTALLLEQNIHSRSKRESLYRVFHLNHAKHLHVDSLESIVGQNWLDIRHP